MANKFVFPVAMHHFSDMQSKLMGAENAPTELHPMCQACMHLMYWDRLERIAVVLESIASSTKAPPLP